MGRQRVDVKQIQPLYGQKQETTPARPLSYVDLLIVPGQLLVVPPHSMCQDAWGLEKH